jgi:hypothetical protein
VNQLPHWVLAIYCGISNENGENIGNVAKLFLIFASVDPFTPHRRRADTSLDQSPFENTGMCAILALCRLAGTGLTFVFKTSISM